MNWNSVKGDQYYEARRLETQARRQRSAELWREFAERKEAKGSYALAVYGYLRAGALIDPSALEELTAVYDAALDVCQRAGYRELAMIVAYTWAEALEAGGDGRGALAVYERLGRFLEREEAWFMAADAYEHAAQVLAETGGEVRDYHKPLELWERNARFWREKGDHADARWSEERQALYRRLHDLEV